MSLNKAQAVHLSERILGHAEDEIRKFAVADRQDIEVTVTIKTSDTHRRSLHDDDRDLP